MDGSDNALSVCARAYATVNQTTPHGTVAKTNSGETAEISVNVVSAVGELVVDACHEYNNTPGVGAGQTQRSAQSTTIARMGTSEEAGATSVTMSWTTGYHATLLAVPLKPTADFVPRVMVF